jgi:hypothetical protein
VTNRAQIKENKNMLKNTLNSVCLAMSLRILNMTFVSEKKINVLKST